MSQVDFGVAPTAGDFLLGIAVGMVAYTGIETISNMAEETRDAKRTVPRGVGLTVIAVIGLYALLPAIALSAMPVTRGADGEYTTELGTTYADDPVLGIVQNLGLGEAATGALEVYVGLLAAVILLIATNAALIGVSRLTFSMGQYRQLPERLRQVHPRWGTPYVAILAFSVVAALTIIPGETTFLATMYSFGAMLSFTIAHASVIWLRRREANVDRPWKPPGSVRAFGFDLPITAVLGGLGTFGAWLVVMALEPSTLLAGGGWMLIGVTGYVLYRRRQRLPLAETVKVQSLQPLGVEEVEYRSVLVAFEDDPFREDTIATAARLASTRRRGIHIVSLINVPRNLALDAPLEEKESAAQAKIERAKLIARGRVTGHTLRVRQGQAGHAIVDEALGIDAAAVVMQLNYRNGTPLYGSTLRTVLNERPCRVIVAAQPDPAAIDAARGLGSS